ncbi:DUF1611 domain-containing protein [Streptomonospora sp. S1-112]|uniref:DUF1611 domain-containing protein n=1 Tax=Streptomonospora mangrovi TaxID=2883123 RepID=A0A9X3NJ64_9ACTN|nr:DUF1611 domain-containing protein [Streptomonospora mangrovi]MDA0564218.1 DUF1611 domain-containing protein [Streptomonospora mangrovi]
MTVPPASAVSGVELHRLTDARRAALKVSYTVRALDTDRPEHVLSGPGVRPRHGDIVLARVTAIGKHTRLETAVGRRAHLYPGDEVLVAYGARYAPDQFEAEPPEDLRPCHLVAAGGIASEVVSAHDGMAAPTSLEPVGLVADASGTPVNLADLVDPADLAGGADLAGPVAPRERRGRGGVSGLEGLRGAEGAPVPAVRAGGRRRGAPAVSIAVVGTSMNAGKTTTGAALVRGLTAAGYRVGAAKVTGTGAGGDRWMYQDSGAVDSLDFTDAGLATTYRVPVDRILASAHYLLDRLAGAGADAVVLEVADGVLQPETAELLRNGGLTELARGCVFAAGDAAGALYGTERVRESGLPVLAASGRMTASPLAVRESQQVLDAPVYGIEDLADPAIAGGLASRLSMGPVLDSVAEWTA